MDYFIYQTKGQIAGWEDFAGSAFSAVANIVTNTQNRRTTLETQDTNVEIERLRAEQSANALQTARLMQQNTPNTGGNNTLLYAGVAVGGVAVVGTILYFAFK